MNENKSYLESPELIECEECLKLLPKMCSKCYLEYVTECEQS